MSTPAHHLLHPLIRDRWSPRAFADTPVTGDQVILLLEAARWASSCYNDQPWHFLVAHARQQEAFGRMVSCLVPANQGWAAHAPLMMVTVVREAFTHNGKPNDHAIYDMGAAVAQLTMQATALELAVHQMAGFDPHRARQLYGIPEGHRAVTALAIGPVGDPASLPDPLREMEVAPAERHTLSEFAFGDQWGVPLAAGADESNDESSIKEGY